MVYYMPIYVGLHDAPYVLVKFLDRYSVSYTLSERNSSLLTQFLSDCYRPKKLRIVYYTSKYEGLHEAPSFRVKFLGGYSVSSTPQNEIYRYSPIF